MKAPGGRYRPLGTVISTRAEEVDRRVWIDVVDGVGDGMSLGFGQALVGLGGRGVLRLFGHQVRMIAPNDVSEIRLRQYPGSRWLCMTEMIST